MGDTSASGSGPYTNVSYLARVTPADHAGWVWVEGLLTLIYPLLSVYVRMQVRIGTYDIDDFTILVATALSLAQHSTLFTALAKGLGKAVSVMPHISAAPAVLASQYLFVLVHGAAKISLALFIRRLFDNKAVLNTRLSTAVVALQGVWVVAALIGLSAGCSPRKFLTSNTYCQAELSRWYTVTAVDIASELGLIVVPALLISRVMVTRGAKILVMASFMNRIPIIVFAALHTHSIAMASQSSDPSFAYIIPIAWQQVTLGWSLISASIPSFRAFIKPLEDANYGGTNVSTASGQLYSQYTGAYLMMGPERSDASTSGAKHKRNIMKLRPEKPQVTSRVESVPEEQRSVRSNDSREDIIRKGTGWRVDYDERVVE